MAKINSYPTNVFVSGSPVIGAPGTFNSLGTGTLYQLQVKDRTASAEGYDSASTRMLPAEGQALFCGAVLRGDRYYSLGVSGGHSGSYDDGLYEFDLVTNTWLTRLPFTTNGSTSIAPNAFGEWPAGPVGRPAAQHSNSHQVVVGNDIIQAHGYSIGYTASFSRQAHRWNATTGLWERYGTNSGSIPIGTAFCFYDSMRNLIVRMPGDANTPTIDTIPANDPSASWSVTNLAVNGQPPGSLYKGIGYHPILDCYVLVSPRDFTPTNRVYILDAANMAAGWKEAPASGAMMPSSANWLGLEYIPTKNSFAIPSLQEPNKLYYLKPSGAKTDAWIWSSETFVGSASPANWDASGPNNRIRWSATLKGLVMLKNCQSPMEIFFPS